MGNDWSFSGNSATLTPTVTGIGTNILTFSTSQGSLAFTYSNGSITAQKTGNTVALTLGIFNGKKLR